MDEDLLSPVLGRLIDEVKALTGAGKAQTEALAFLLDDDSIVTATSVGVDAGASPVEAAVAKVRADGTHKIVAVAVAAGPEAPQGAPLSDQTRQVLAAIDADLPTVMKRRGRWVVRPLSQVSPTP